MSDAAEWWDEHGDDLGDDECCQRCHGAGWICVCPDDLCRHRDDGCMHGDGNIVCPDCNGRDLEYIP